MRSRLVSSVAVAMALGAALADAHPPPKTVLREIVRLQGTRRADGDAPAGPMTLRAQGTEHPFAASFRQAYGLIENENEGAPKVADRYTLQGPRELLNQFASARPNQTVTILAEHRPGSTDLFLLALDLCPPK